MYERILVPLDGSRTAEAALPHARSLASRLHAELILLRVDEPVPNLPRSRYPREIEAEARRYLRAVAEPMELKRLRVRTAVEYGDPAEVIRGFAERNRVDLIVMAMARRRGLGRLLRLGVVPRLLDLPPAPVFLVVTDGGPGGRAAEPMPPASVPTGVATRARRLPRRPPLGGPEP